jgi:hypothetical protein
VKEALYYNDYYLKNSVEYEQGLYNIVRTPCGSGKTFHCLNFITEPQKFTTRLGKHQNTKLCLYVTDTSALRESVVSDYEMKTGRTVAQYDERKNLTVWTYAKLSQELKKYRGKEEVFISKYDYIFLDEVHQLFKYSERFDKRTMQQTEHIEDVALYNDIIDLLPVFREETTLICLSATPKPLIDFIHDTDDEILYMNDIIPVTKLHKIKCYTENYKIPVWDMQETVRKIDMEENDKMFIFARTIDELLNYEEICQKKGLTTTVLWSIHSEKEMTEEQLSARQKLLDDGEFDTDVIIMNGAYESGINIEHTKDSQQQTIFVMVASSDDIQITQARGRIRHNIDSLFYLDCTLNHLQEKGREKNLELCERMDKLVEQCQDEESKKANEHLFIGQVGLRKLATIINVWSQYDRGNRYLITTQNGLNDFFRQKQLDYEIVKKRKTYKQNGKKKEYTFYYVRIKR